MSKHVSRRTFLKGGAAAVGALAAGVIPRAEAVAAASAEADACTAPHAEGEESAECTCEAPATSTPEFAASEQTNGVE